MLVLILNKKNTLAQVPLTGGLPRELDENILGADWSPDGKSMAIAKKEFGPIKHLEYPPGKILYKSTQRIDTVRFSQNGDHIAFIQGLPDGSNGNVKILSISGKEIASSSLLYPESLSWSPDGNEVWFSTVSDRVGGGYELYSLSLAGKQRLISHFPSSFILHDISKQGKLIAEFSDDRGILMTGSDGNERELSWLDNSDIRDFSSDGKMLLIHERGDGSESPGGTIYIRGLDGSAAIRLAAGTPICFSPDNLFVLGFDALNSLMVVPVRAGSLRRFEYNQFKFILTAEFLPDGKQFLILGADNEGRTEVFFQDVSGGKLKSSGIKNFYSAENNKLLSPDGRLLLGLDGAGTIRIYNLEKASPVPFSGFEEGETPIKWNQSSDAIFVFNPKVPARVYKITLADGSRTLFKEITPPNRAGVTRVQSIRISSDEKSYAYTYVRRNGTLYLLDGVR